MGSIAVILAVALAFASKKFSVQMDPRVEKIMGVLPNANCGACGFAGCAAYAEAVAVTGASTALCAPGGEKSSRGIADIMGVAMVSTEPMIAAVHCKGGDKEAVKKFTYNGVPDCRAAVLLGGGHKECPWGCLGLGSCVNVCAFDAIHINSNGLAVVDAKKCTGCGKCVAICPKMIIHLMPAAPKIFLACSNHDRGAKVRRYCSVGCNACTLCVKATPSGAIEMKDNLPVLDYSREENFVAAAHKCPQGCYTDLAVKRPKVSIDQKCNGCTECVKVCPVRGAIDGKPNGQHKVAFDKCIGCGRCIAVCPVHAINLMGALGARRR